MAGQTFSGIPVRDYTGPVTPNWWNILRLAGVNVETLLGIVGGYAETQFTFANNSGVTNIAGLTFDHAGTPAIGSAVITFEVRRYTETSRANCNVTVYLGWDDTAAAWFIQDVEEHGDYSGLTFGVTTAGTVGQLTYSSSNMSGSGYSGASRYRATVMGT